MKKEYLEKKGTYKVTFSLPKEAVNGAKEVVVLGDFNNWDRKGIAMNSKNGQYQTAIELNAGRYEYRYLIDNDRWENDWKADAYVSSPFDGIENSVISLDDVAVPAKKTKKASKAKTITKGKTEPVAKAAPKTKETAKPKAAKKTNKKASAVSDKDDLTKIEGIGAKLATVLAEAGITTFKQLAATKSDKIVEMLIAYNPRYRMYNPTTWGQQAKLAAAGKWDELKKLQDELIGGKAKK